MKFENCKKILHTFNNIFKISSRGDRGDPKYLYREITDFSYKLCQKLKFFDGFYIHIPHISWPYSKFWRNLIVLVRIRGTGVGEIHPPPQSEYRNFGVGELTHP